MAEEPYDGAEIMRTCAIVLHYGQVSDTLECLNNLRGKVDHVWLVDNQNDLPRIRRQNVDIIKPGFNLGFSRGVNLAIAWADINDYDAFLLINNDCTLDPETLPKLKYALQLHRLAFVLPTIYRYPSGEIWSQGWWYSPSTGLGFSRRPPAFLNPLWCYTFCCCLISSECLQTIGLLDERIFCYGEDIEYCHRAREAGLRFAHVEDAVCWHKQNGPSKDKSVWFEQQMARIRYQLAEYCSNSGMNTKASKILVTFFLVLRATVRLWTVGNANSFRGLVRELAG